MKVSVDGLEDAVRAELEQYASEVQEEVDSAVVRVARRCLAQIRRNSPKKTGDYRKGWTMKTEKGRLNTVALIYNRTRYFLIHLLEFGYQKAAGGRVEGEPHVEPTEQQAERELLTEITDILRGR